MRDLAIHNSQGVPAKDIVRELVIVKDAPKYPLNSLCKSCDSIPFNLLKKPNRSELLLRYNGQLILPFGIYLFKVKVKTKNYFQNLFQVNNKDIKTSMTFGVFIVNLDHISHLFLLLLLLL